MTCFACKQKQMRTARSAKLQNRAPRSRRMASDDTKLLERRQLKILELVNMERKKCNLNSVRTSRKLEKCATLYNKRLALVRGHISHSFENELQDRLGDVKYAFAWGSENLAAGYETCEEAMQAWMNSPGHRSNILSKKAVQIGIHVMKGKGDRIFWIQVFGKPKEAK